MCSHPQVRDGKTEGGGRSLAGQGPTVMSGRAGKPAPTSSFVGTALSTTPGGLVPQLTQERSHQGQGSHKVVLSSQYRPLRASGSTVWNTPGHLPMTITSALAPGPQEAFGHWNGRWEGDQDTCSGLHLRGRVLPCHVCGAGSLWCSHVPCRGLWKPTSCAEGQRAFLSENQAHLLLRALSPEHSFL